MSSKSSKAGIVTVTLGSIIALTILTIILVSVSKPQKAPEHYDNPVLEKIKENFKLLNPRFAKVPLEEGNSSYTENKEVITLCLKKPETGEYYDMNTLMYVSLHELGHVVSKTHGHNDEFKRNFAKILRRASQIGIYDPRIPIPATYCGVTK